MGPPKGLTAPRVVLDTNCVVSALVFSQGRCAWLRHARQAGRFVPLLSRDTASELLRVLTYPRFHLNADERETLLSDYLPWAHVVDVDQAVADATSAFSALRDPTDAIFLTLALKGSAEVLVSGDGDLLAVREHFEVPIMDASGFRHWLEHR